MCSTPFPAPLRDRMEVIELTGYTEEEKLQIARRYLLTRQLQANGLTADQVQISDEALRRVIVDYTREAGVRGLERQIGALLRNAAVTIASGRAAQRLDRRRRRARHPGRCALRERCRAAHQRAGRGHRARVDAGGRRHSVHRIEPGKGHRQADPDRAARRGHEGKRAGGGHAWSNHRRTGWGSIPRRSTIATCTFTCPAGAIPKDGPSAGVAMATSLASLLTQRTVRADVAMTGEISLRGVVLPVGGIKEKCVAAARAGIRTVILPARNRRDLEDIPESVRNRLEFVWAEKIDDVLARALEAAPVHRAAA